MATGNQGGSGSGNKGREEYQDAKEYDEVFRVGVKVPPFWTEDPDLWFSQLEGQFALAGIKNEDTKFYHTISKLEYPIANEVRDIIKDPPESNQYTKLKTELIGRLSLSKEKKLRQLLSHEELGDRKPSQFLRSLQSMAGKSAGGADYRCDVCGARYDQPNPLKIHLFLECEPPTARAFWARLVSRLSSADSPPPPAPPPSPAAVEALAAAWGSWGARGAGHACLYCGKLYSRKYGLKIHIRTHTGYKPLRCGHCARRFGDPSNLNKHVRLHASGGVGGEGREGGRHACARCGAVLARRRDLERHLRTRHPAPPDTPLPAG